MCYVNLIGNKKRVLLKKIQIQINSQATMPVVRYYLYTYKIAIVMKSMIMLIIIWVDSVDIDVEFNSIVISDKYNIRSGTIHDNKPIKGSQKF